MLIQSFERIPLEVNLIPMDSVMALQKGKALCKKSKGGSLVSVLKKGSRSHI